MDAKFSTLVVIFLSVLCVQSSKAGDRFTILEVDGHAHVIRSADGQYSSFNELPKSVRDELSKSSVSQAQMKSRSAIPSSTMTTFVVSSASDAEDTNLNDGVYSPATLRSAIQNANKLGGSQAISFSPGITTIQPATQLPSVTVALTIDGTTSSGKVILDGSGTTATIGLSLGKTSTVTNMIFTSWKSLGLALSSGAVNSIVQRCEFTLNSVGLNINAAGTLVGSETPGDRNLAYGNTQDGIDLVYANDNIIINNFCGTKDGTTASPNTYNGIYILGERTDVIHNVLSGNLSSGLEIGEFSKTTLVMENLIGVDFSGSGKLSNTSNGINTFADNDSIIDNVISGNGYGITVLGQASQTYIGNNSIGLNFAQDDLIGNQYGGLQVLGEKVVIDNNFICGNTNSGIQITGWGGAVVKRNYIGIDPTGTLDWGNSGAGIYISADNNIIGGPRPDDINIISGNGGSGIEMYGGTTLSFPGGSKPHYVRGNVIQNNYVGTDHTGSANIPNHSGISMQGYVDSNFVRKNLVSGNQHHGVWLQLYGGSPTRNVFTNNFIGTSSDGTKALPNRDRGIYILAGSNNIFGGSTIDDKNLISGNIGPGVWISGYSSANKIMSNLIGTDVSGDLPLPNTVDGVLIDQAALNNVIQWNLISGNGRNGVNIETNSNLTPSGNVIIGNNIGLEIAKTFALPNKDNGVLINNARNTRIGGSTLDSSNIISGNVNYGVYIYGNISSGNMIRGNYIGTDASGDKAIPNYSGVAILNSNGNIIGGSEYGSGNLISGNSHDGVYLYVADSNSVYGNFIGLDILQAKTLPNGNSGVVVDSANHNVIGGDQAGAGNTIAGNKFGGIALSAHSTGNKIFNNSIGSDFTGTKKFGNEEDGIQIVYGANETSIGKIGAGNKIKFNKLAGIIIADSNQNRISANSIFDNGSLGIDLFDDHEGVTPNDALDPDRGANNLQNFPELLHSDGPSPLRIFGELHSEPNKPYRVEFFATDLSDASGYGEGKDYLGFADVTTNALGVASINVVLGVAVSPGKLITSTATDSLGNTSEFSHCVPVETSGLFADVAVTVTANADTIRKADTLVYILTLQNNGPDIATQVMVKDTLSNHVTFIADSVLKGKATFATGVLTYMIDTLEAGKKINIALIVKADSTGFIFNKAFASAQESDFYLSNNVDSDTTVVSIILAVGGEANSIPETFLLSQNYPNPFNPSTTIRFGVPVTSRVNLRVYDILGREIVRLAEGVYPAGYVNIIWSAPLASGIYFYRLESTAVADPSRRFVQTRRMLILK
jgi:uncharacterized repeat protein (TIGR01451 family)